MNQKKRLDEFTMKMIRRRREATKNGEAPERKSLLDYMLEISDANPDFTEHDIVNEACTFMLAVRIFYQSFVYLLIDTPAGSRLSRSFNGFLPFPSRTASRPSREMPWRNWGHLRRRWQSPNDEWFEGNETSWDVHKRNFTVSLKRLWLSSGLNLVSNDFT